MITSTTSLETNVAECVRLKLAHTTMLAKIEAEKTEIERKYAKQVAESEQRIVRLENTIQAYCVANRGALFPVNKSLETRTAVIGFETTPPRVDKPRKLTWDAVLARLRLLPWAGKYIRPGVDSVNKEALLQDRKDLSEEQQKLIGISFEQEEQFYIRPIPAMAEASSSAV